MESESKKTIRYFKNQPASVHNYGKLNNRSESPRTHSSTTSILRKFPHSLRHDQKHQTKIKRNNSSVNMILSGMTISKERKNGNRNVKSWCIGDETASDESEERPSSEDTVRCIGASESSDVEDSRKKRKFSETSAGSDCSTDSEVWKLQTSVVNTNKYESVQECNERTEGTDSELMVDKPSRVSEEEPNPKDEVTIGSIRKLSVINNSLISKRVEGRDGYRGSSVNLVSDRGKRTEFPVHKSTPNLLRSETLKISSSMSHPDCTAVDRSSDDVAVDEFPENRKPTPRHKWNRNNRHVPMKSCDSLPHLDHRYRLIHSILPKLNRPISESHESLSSFRKPGINLSRMYMKSESHINSENFYNNINRSSSTHSKMFEVGGKSDLGRSDDENEGLSLIDNRRNIIIQSSKDRKEVKNRWSYKKTVDLMPNLKNFITRINRSGGSGAGAGGGGAGSGGGGGGGSDNVETETEDVGPPGASLPLITSRSVRSESCSSLNIPKIRYFDEDEDDLAVKKCETMYTLTNLQVEPIKPTNRLRVPPNGFSGSTSRMCSRCSSLLSMASSSRYSINTTGSGFVNCSPSADKLPEPIILCKLCLMEVPVSLSMEINHCGCVFCKDCMRLYVEFEIQKGAYDISCPDAQCIRQGVVTLSEVESLVMPQMMERYLRFRLNHEVDMDRNRTWCPRAGCETVCNICPREKCSPTNVHCPTCDSDFCSNCKNSWHKGLTCEENSKKLAREGRVDFMEPPIPFDSDSIKCCPMCNVPIEKDEGCAQMMCKRCKHVFCWYCLASLDDDFLLRHYDKGPCKNKLGHSRASVIWHRTQVIGIFAGLGLLLLVASPLLLLAAPCIVCCKCRVCSGTKLDGEDDLPEESGT